MSTDEEHTESNRGILYPKQWAGSNLDEEGVLRDFEDWDEGERERTREQREVIDRLHDGVCPCCGRDIVMIRCLGWEGNAMVCLNPDESLSMPGPVCLHVTLYHGDGARSYLYYHEKGGTEE